MVITKSNLEKTKMTIGTGETYQTEGEYTETLDNMIHTETQDKSIHA